MLEEDTYSRETLQHRLEKAQLTCHRVGEWHNLVFNLLSEHLLTYGHGTDNPWDEATYLVFETLHLPYDNPESLLDRPLTESETHALMEKIEGRIIDYIPTAYLTNRAHFANLTFYVDDRVLIPRSPIAELILNEFSPWVKPDQVKHIADLGTGCGAITIACAKAFPEATVDAVDTSLEALRIAQGNCKTHGVQDRVRLIQSHWFVHLPAPLPTYDIIVSNPPYVGREEMEALPEEYRHEPEEALYSGEDGLMDVVEILRDAAAFLSPKGILVVEVGNAQEALEEAYPHVPFIWLDFAEGGQGVFLLSYEELVKHVW